MEVKENNSSSAARRTFTGVNPATGEALETVFTESTPEEVDAAVRKAEEAFTTYRLKTSEERAAFLERIGEEIMALGDDLLNICSQETGLPLPRLQGERGRTVNQLRLFAEIVREGSWVNARIDKAQPDRQPLPKPDLRQMQIPLGPVGVFGASNFPFAFSVAGGDTASALAAGCTVVVKAHPAHPGTSEMVGNAIIKAAKAAGMPDGTLSFVHGTSVEVGMAIVTHPLIKAIGFTGSTRGGTAIFAAAAARPEPIPVYAEMGSTNPVFILPRALKEREDAIAQGLAASVTLGVGQFCTNPGLVVTLDSDISSSFLQKASKHFEASTAGTMLTPGIKQAYDSGLQRLQKVEGVKVLAQGAAAAGTCGGVAHLLQASAETILGNPELAEEVFGPSSLAVTASDKDQVLEFARNLHGHLTATIHATAEDLEEYAELVQILERKVGRILFNGYPTGVEVSHAMVHGGPFPATSDSRSTSVGTLAIYRFARPVCYQDFPAKALPAALQNDNPLNIWRMVDGQFTKESI
ncbi:aldehyde dehydrogenase (NADP(+)) [Adhaeribacter aquaticus]|uniref:aldehyde dehydrogenase (NADP(+)) n=1 Tax=Adhaeribacter aquaticus TaxID=299567 RepID=UPI0003FB1E33|nr:aldehyde dehydrogenase (NADP(+)) [Adhaeribacter aquaticus]